MIDSYEAITVSPLFPLPLYISLVSVSVSLKELRVKGGGLLQEITVDDDWN